MSEFKDLVHTPYGGGTAAQMSFDNGYGVSVIRHSFSYGHEDDLYELAVLKGDELCYDTPITNDVVGWLTEDAVTVLMQRVAALPKVSN